MTVLLDTPSPQPEEVDIYDMGITVTVSGPGGAINFDVDLIEQALLAVGYRVKVENKHATGDKYEYAAQEHQRRPQLLTLIANHRVWGG